LTDKQNSTGKIDKLYTTHKSKQRKIQQHKTNMVQSAWKWDGLILQHSSAHGMQHSINVSLSVVNCQLPTTSQPLVMTPTDVTTLTASSPTQRRSHRAPLTLHLQQTKSNTN